MYLLLDWTKTPDIHPCFISPSENNLLTSTVDLHQKPFSLTSLLGDWLMPTLQGPVKVPQW